MDPRLHYLGELPVKLREDLSGALDAFDVIKHDFAIAEANEKIRELASKLVKSQYDIIAVLDNDRLVGIITAKALVEALVSKLDDLTAKDLVVKDYPILHANWSLSKALGVMLLGGVCCAPVVYEDGRLAGIVTLPSISKVMIEDIDVEELHAAD